MPTRADQHFLLTYDLRSLPRWLRLHVSYMSLVVRAYDARPAERIVSSFYFPPLKRGCGNVTQVGVLLRPEVVNAPVTQNGHLVACWRRFAPKGALTALAECGREGQAKRIQLRTGAAVRTSKADTMSALPFAWGSGADSRLVCVGVDPANYAR